MDMETPAGPRESAAAAGDDDRLSELPDCLLTNILSRVTSRQAALSSALSRWWRHLWRTVPCVDIDQREFRGSEAIDEYAAGADVRLASAEKIRLSVEESELFTDLGDRLLPPLDVTPHPPQLDALRLRVSCLDFRSTGRRLVRRGLGRRPVEFHLSCDNDVPLALYNEKFPQFPGLTLPRYLGDFARRLRTMRLSGLGLKENFANCLADDFLVLEDLHLEDCEYGFCRLASDSLRKLSIDHCCRGYAANDVLAIATPRMASLHINCGTSPVNVVGDMPALLAASLEHPAGELGLLRSLRCARSLDLSGFSTTALLGGQDPEEFPVFGNLRTLLLDGCDVGVECQVLRRFLGKAPSLETLTMRDCTFTGGSRSKKRKARSGEKTTSSSDRCSLTSYECKNLKSVELEFCDGDAIDELAQALVGISKQVVRPMESSVQDGMRRIKFSYT